MEAKISDERRLTPALWFRFGLIWLDQGVNWFLGPPLNWISGADEGHRFGHPDITLSAVLGSGRDSNRFHYWGARFVNVLFFWQRDHCGESVEYLRF